MGVYIMFLMNRKLNVKSGISPTGHSSIDAAIASSKRELQNYKEIKGKRVVEIDYSPSAIKISFENTDFLAIIEIADNRIDCTIIQEIPDHLSSATPAIPDQIKLDFLGTIVDWDRTRFFDQFIGKIIAISPSDQYLFVFVKGGAEYMCDYLIEKNNAYEPFLYLSEY